MHRTEVYIRSQYSTEYKDILKRMKLLQMKAPGEEVPREETPREETPREEVITAAEVARLQSTRWERDQAPCIIAAVGIQQAKKWRARGPAEVRASRETVPF